MDPKKGLVLQRAFYKFAGSVAGGILSRATQFSCEKYEPKSDVFMLLGNHTMDLDPIYAVLATGSHMRFVASANIMRGFPGCFVKWLAGPIPREKGAPADDVVEAVKANLAAGVSVAMYPEGNTTWDGETGFISKRTAQLVKDSEGGLITFRTVGGYLRMPRWSVVKRKGPSFAKVVREYTREELNAMSVDEILDAVKRDLYVDAYEEQEERHWKYDCSARAEGLEGALYVCPACRRVGQLHSKQHSFSCSCGNVWFFDNEGYLTLTDDTCETANVPARRQVLFANAPAAIRGALRVREEGASAASEQGCPAGLRESTAGAFGNKNPVDAPFDYRKTNILEWARWQKDWLRENRAGLRFQTDSPICENSKVKVFGDRLEIDGEKYFYEDITKMSVFRSTRLFFTCNGEHHELTMNDPDEHVGQMYFALWMVCTGKEYL